MSEKGVVVGLEGNRAIVEMEASKDCEACGACRYTESGRMVTPVVNTLSAKPGDMVRIDIEPQVVIAAALVVYILPIVMFFAGYGLFLWIGRVSGLTSGAVGIAGGLVFLASSYFAVRSVDKRAGISHRFEPKMYDIIRSN